MQASGWADSTEGMDYTESPGAMKLCQVGKAWRSCRRFSLDKPRPHHHKNSLLIAERCLRIVRDSVSDKVAGSRRRSILPGRAISAMGCSVSEEGPQV